MSSLLPPPHADAALRVHGPAAPSVPLVLDSPHSGFEFPADFDAQVSEFELRDGEDCFIDELYLPATEQGIALIAARFPRTYLDPNRHAGDIDLDLLEGGHWPHEYLPSGKARIGKALIWRTLDDGRPIYAGRLTVERVVERIARYHRPYHATVQQWIEATHARFGVSYHVNCHSMNAVAGAQGEGGAGRTRPDFVLGDRDGSTCSAAFTECALLTLRGMGYDVKVNDPFKGVELVRAYSDPGRGRHSLQIEVNKRLYLDEAARERNAGFATVQRDLARLVEALAEHAGAAARRARS